MVARSSVVLSLLVATLGLAGCASPTEEDGVDDQTSNVTGGSGSVDSPVAYIFEAAAATNAKVMPKCAGAMLSPTFAVTAKACAKTGLFVGRATDKDGKKKQAKIKAVHLPESADADIAVVELDKALDGMNAVITHMPLRDGYAVNSFASVDGAGFFAPDKGEASSVKGAMIEESATHGAIVPAKGSEICEGDLGAPVCSVSSFKIAGRNISGTCGLAGLVVGPAAALDAAAPAPQPGASAPAETTQNKCSGKAWKVAQLGQHAAFLKKFAPKAFEPVRVLGLIPYAPAGLWGYQTKGDIKSCKIETTSLATTKAGAPSSKISAKVSFAGMQKKAAPVGRFGIAPKSDPTNMRWLPAKVLNAPGTAAFDSLFEGVVAAEKDGQYVVAFRASANGGESWTMCDSDGIENGFSIEKALALQIADAAAPTTPPTGGEPTPQGQPAPSGGYSDPPPTGGSEESGYQGGDEESDPSADAEEELAPKKKDESSGCSVSSGSGTTSSALPLGGVLLGLAMIARRRRRQG